MKDEDDSISEVSGNLIIRNEDDWNKYVCNHPCEIYEKYCFPQGYMPGSCRNLVNRGLTPQDAYKIVRSEISGSGIKKGRVILAKRITNRVAQIAAERFEKISAEKKTINEYREEFLEEIFQILEKSDIYARFFVEELNLNNYDAHIRDVPNLDAAISFIMVSNDTKDNCIHIAEEHFMEYYSKYVLKKGI